MKQRIDSQQQRRQDMNLDEAGNNLEAFRKRVQQRWRQLGDEQVERIAGRREQLSRELERTYGLSHEDAEAEIDDFERGGGTVAGQSSGRGVTERMREAGSGNEQRRAPREGDRRHH